MNKQENSIILFDGICKLCDGFVGFISKRDRSGKFRFIPLQSAKGQGLRFAEVTQKIMLLDVRYWILDIVTHEL